MNKEQIAKERYALESQMLQSQVNTNALNAQKLAAEKRKETALTGFIMALIVAVSFAIAAIGATIGYTLDYDTIANLFFSSVLVLAAIVVIENTSKLLITASVFSGVFVATGLYLIWGVQ